MRSFWIACSHIRPLVLLSVSSYLVPLIPIVLHPHIIHAARGDAITHGDHNHPRILDPLQALDLRTDAGFYEPNFLGLDRSIIGRAEVDDQALANNAPGQLNIEEGDSQFWTFPKQALFGPKSPRTPGLPSPLQGQQTTQTPNSSDERILYISLTTCLQPNPKSPNTKGPPKQLELYVSTDSGNKKPSRAKNDHNVTVDEGFGWLNLSVKDDVYFGVSALENDDFAGVYNYQLTASIDGFYASYYDETNLYFIDSDTSSALLYTNATFNNNASLPEFHEWMNGPPRFSIFVQNQDNPSILGMQKSICALQDFADVRTATAFDTGMTLAGDSNPKQQFYVRTLNASSSYYAIAAVIGNSTKSGNGIVGGGGMVWNSSSLKTKSSMFPYPESRASIDGMCASGDNCALLYNLPFCNSVAYSAPANFSNPNVSDITALSRHYDDYARSQYLNFSRSLEQIPCNTTSSAQYSLTKTCDDCDEAYRTWLCAVTIPRCEDISNLASYLQPRALNQSFSNSTLAAQNPALSRLDKSRVYVANSRNYMIDIDIKPGPYNEVLPCDDLCYDLVRSCPASLQFVCPLKDYGFNYTYGVHNQSDPGACSFPGAGLPRPSAASRTGTRLALIAFSVALVLITL